METAGGGREVLVLLMLTSARFLPLLWAQLHPSLGDICLMLCFCGLLGGGGYQQVCQLIITMNWFLRIGKALNFKVYF